MANPDFSINISKLNSEQLTKIANTRGLPHRLLDGVEMLQDLRSEGSPYEPVEGADLSEDWTILTSPLTLQRIRDIIRKWF